MRRNRIDWLSMAATPSFAAMAFLTWLQGSPATELCSAAQGVSPLSGMTLMYALMSVFHAKPWLRLIEGSIRKLAKG